MRSTRGTAGQPSPLKTPSPSGPESSAACARASPVAAKRCRRSYRPASPTRSTSPTWERLEEALILADVGAKTTAEVVQRLEDEAAAGDLAAVGPCGSA